MFQRDLISLTFPTNRFYLDYINMHGHHGDWASLRGDNRVVTQGNSVAQYIIVHRIEDCPE